MPQKKAKISPNPSPAYIERLRQQRRSLGLLQFESRSDRNLTKWENMTENIVISCFGEGSNQHDQFTDLTANLIDASDLSTDSLFTYKSRPPEFKDKMKDLLTNFIEELELKLDAPDEGAQKRSSVNISSKIQVTATQISIQRTEISNTITQILERIREVEPDSERVKEAEKNLGEFQEEIEKEKPQWSVIKKALIWLLEFSRDAFLQVLPILIERYSK
jgi:hypothetical protein